LLKSNKASENKEHAADINDTKRIASKSEQSFL